MAEHSFDLHQERCVYCGVGRDEADDGVACTGGKRLSFRETLVLGGSTIAWIRQLVVPKVRPANG